MQQASLFDLVPPPSRLPAGFVYQPGFLSPADEAGLLALVRTLPFAAARYKAYTARRRVVSYGGSFDYDANRLQPTAELIPELHGLRDRAAAWLGVPPEALVHALVAEYAPGTPLGWHRDVPQFEDVVGISLGSEAILRFRPYPPVAPKKADVVRVAVAPRSIYRLQGPARWAWQHSVAPTGALRWSITFRTCVRPADRTACSCCETETPGERSR
ncbi:alpha-ketoglutarate-dependent dioxygenase AlkB [Pigmentiphaga soli]|uniref:Alpha-ketoglutarate-dependent dioxygenase AlkB n=1 Tax=Pigmentiphaga soli TaxID=1007095 RepID=A0ABP8HET7_9BURK